MNAFDGVIAAALRTVVTSRAVAEGTRVTTQCLYPGGRCVPVLVGRRGDGYAVTDDGAGWDELLACGVDVAPSSHGRKAKAIADVIGVDWRHGSFRVAGLEPPQLAAGIVLVANASQRWVTEVLGERQARVERGLRRRVAEQLARLFAAERLRPNLELAGDSTKTYAFSNVVSLQDRLLIVEPVTNHANAVAASFLKLTDVHRAHPEHAREIVVEDMESWASADLNILSEAADGIRDLAGGLESLRAKYAA